MNDLLSQLFNPSPGREEESMMELMRDRAATNSSIQYLHQRIDNVVARLAELEVAVRALKDQP